MKFLTVYMANLDWLLWVGLALIFFGLLRLILRIFMGKKIKQQVNGRNLKLQRQTQDRLGRDAIAEKQLVDQLKKTKDEKNRKELLKKAGLIGKDEEIISKKGA